jgi:universal stress protein A
MENYKHILLAVDFFDQTETVINRAKDLATSFKAKLSIIHVVDSLPIVDAGFGSDVPFNMDLSTEFLESAKARLTKLAENLDVNADNQFLEVGSPKQEIVRIASEQGVDLIVVGSHGRHGLALLLGSTANAILHYAKCDVLAVRLMDDD